MMMMMQVVPYPGQTAAGLAHVDHVATPVEAVDKLLPVDLAQSTANLEFNNFLLQNKLFVFL